MQHKPAPLTPAEYLQHEARSAIKHEYVNGETYAMAGAKRRHNLIATNIASHAWNAATGRDCQVFGSDMKVYIQAHNSFYYPDVSVCCDPTDREELFLSRPCFIAEVLSPSTASVDRREKRASYTTLESLREYAIVDQDRMRVELYRREHNGWQGYVLNQSNDIIESTCLNLHLTLTQIYQGVEFPTNIAEQDAPEYSGN
jgi:Uma2 family endonuclease